MPIAETVTIDASQFPENTRRELLEALRARAIPPKFHYESHKQAEQWLALHEAYSPARREADAAEIYERALAAAAERVDRAGARVAGLGCGGGEKEARLLGMLREKKAPVSFLPCDASVPLVLTALRAAEKAAPGICVDPLVCDVARCESLAESIDRVGGQTGMPGRRVFTFFGMAPNLEAKRTEEILRTLPRAEDWLLLSANLAPGCDYEEGVRRVLGGYDNDLTREWLLSFLLDVGFERGDGAIRFGIEDGEAGWKRIVADYEVAREREFGLHGERFVFRKGEAIRLFFSYRHTVSQVEALAGRSGLEIEGRWLAASEEEGVFLCRRSQ